MSEGHSESYEHIKGQKTLREILQVATSFEEAARNFYTEHGGAFHRRAVVRVQDQRTFAHAFVEKKGDATLFQGEKGDATSS